MSSCVSFQSASKLELSQDADVKIGENAPVQKKAGDVLEISDLPIYIKATGKLPILVIPVQSAAKLKVDPPPDNRVIGPARDDSDIGEIVKKFVQAQILLSQRQAESALQIVEELLNAHPQIIYLNFLKSSCLVTLGQPSTALAVLQEALRVYPDDVQGKKLYEFLMRRSNQASPAREKPGVHTP